jgi:hypothetical protein
VVWRRKDAGSSAAGGSDGIGGTAASIPPPAGDADAGGPPSDVVHSAGEGGGHRRRRRRTRRRRNSGGMPFPAVVDPPPVLPPVDIAAEMVGAAPSVRPRRIIDRSERIARAEDELRCALSVLVVGDPAAVSVDGLAAEFARRYDLPVSSLVFHRLSPNDLLLLLPSEEEAVRIYNDGRPIQLDQLSLHCRRWSRFKNAAGVTLPQLVDVEVRGVPAHVWELETAEHLLDEWCWVRALHSDTVQRRDYSSFQLTAWCSCPERIPAAMDLVVVEPPVPVVEAPPVKRALSYEISITVVPGQLPVVEAPPPPPPACEGGSGGRRRRRRDSSSSSSSRRDSPSRGAAPSSPELAGPSGHGGRCIDAVASGAASIMVAATPASSLGAPSATTAPSPCADVGGGRTLEFRKSRRLTYLPRVSPAIKLHR